MCTFKMYIGGVMHHVNITELRQNLPSYLKRVQSGEKIKITFHGKVIARIVPEQEEIHAARKRLFALRKKARIGDITSSSGEKWNAEQGLL